MRLPIFTLLLAALAAAQSPEPPARHVFNPSGALTAPRPDAREAAGDFLRAFAAERGLPPAAVAGAELVKQYTTAHSGVTHFIYRQRFGGLEVSNGEWVVNVDREGQVLNAGGSLFAPPDAGTAPPSPFAATRAAKVAATAVNPGLGSRFRAELLGAKSNEVRLAASGFGGELEGRATWYGVEGKLAPAWEFYVLDEDGVKAYSVIVDSVTQRLLAKESLTWFQNPGAPRGLVFTGQSPQPNPAPGVRLAAPPAFTQRTLTPFTGDPAASPRGWVAGEETAGNNIVAGANPLGLAFTAPATARSAMRDFQPPLELGPDAPNPARFADAASVNLFYWMNRAHDWFYQAGFDEAAGNYQADNFGRGGVAGDAITVYSQYASAGPVRASLDNAFYTSRRFNEDGSPAMIAMYLGSSFGIPGGNYTDGSYDSEVMIHEYTHGVSTRLVRQLSGHHGGALGEAWSDFFALEFTVPDGAPLDGVYPAAEYLFQRHGVGLRSRPYSTDMAVNPLTFGEIGRVISTPEIHEDGTIWVQALWEMRANLIRQLGEREGRRRTRLLTIDGMKLSPPAPTIVDARDAILLADRAGFGGASQSQIWAAFAKRGLGSLAHAPSTDSVHVAQSFDLPSPTASLRFYEPSYVAGETIRLVLQDANNSAATARVQLTSSSGDLETLILRRQGSVFYGAIGASTAPVGAGNGFMTATTGDFITAYYTDENPGSGGARQIESTVGVRLPYIITSNPAPGPYQFTGETPLGLRAGFFVFSRVELPFEFPFFNKKFRSLYVYNNGMLAFETPVLTGCTDRTTLPRFNGIAPLWMELITNGTAQPNEGLYVSRPRPDAITFRWAAETDSSFTAPEPVNMAVTLYEDGRIESRYGPGNKNLSVDFPIAGCPVSTPTVGISNGNESYTQTSAQHLGRPNLENAPALTWIPPFDHSSLPRITLTSPDGGQTTKGVLNGRAIIADTEQFVTKADVYIDGVYRASAVRQGARPAECTGVSGVECAEHTFNLNLGTLGLAAGSHSLWLRAVNWRGGFTDSSAVNFNVEPGQNLAPTVVLEEPATGREVVGNLRVRGYAYSEKLRIGSVDILIDGLTVARSSMVARPDVCAPLRPVPVSCVGFDLNLNTATSVVPILNGPHTLQVRVTDETVRHTLYPETPLEINVRNEANRRPRGVLVSPSNNDRVKGMMTINGHAWDPDGRILQVQLVVNGETRAVIPYGQPRPAECAALEGVTACPNIGFSLDFDSRRLNNGLNILGVRLIDSAGATTILPEVRPNDGGISIVVEN